MKPSLAMFRNMKVYMIGTSDARSTAPGAKEFWTLACTREVPVDRFVRAGMSGVVVDSNIAELRYLSSGFVGSGSASSSASPSRLQAPVYVMAVTSGRSLPIRQVKRLGESPRRLAAAEPGVTNNKYVAPEIS